MIRKTSTTLAALACASALTACSERAQLDPRTQTGADPQLPEPRNFLVPPMQVPTGVGWQGDAHPAVANGLAIEKIADGLIHPRQLLALPNGDVLVVEANGPGTEAVTTPKQLIAGIVKGRSGKAKKGGDRITLLRKQAGTNRWEAHVLIEHLTVEQNVAVGLMARPMDRADRQAAIDHAIDLIGLGNYHAAYPRELSGGYAA